MMVVIKLINLITDSTNFMFSHYLFIFKLLWVMQFDLCYVHR